MAMELIWSCFMEAYLAPVVKKIERRLDSILDSNFSASRKGQTWFNYVQALTFLVTDGLELELVLPANRKCVKRRRRPLIFKDKSVFGVATIRGGK